MKTKHVSVKLAALLLACLSCCVSANAADLVVIRYDAKLIRLNGEMVNALFHEERLKSIRKRLKLEPDVRLQVGFRPSEGEQPDGVLVGSLISQVDVDIDHDSLENAVVRTLRDALNDNLNASFDGLTQQREVVRRSLEVAEKKLQALYSEMQIFDQQSQLALQKESLQKLEARRLDKEIESRISNQRRELLRNRLEEVQASLSQRVAAREDLARELMKAQEAMEHELAGAARDDGKKRKTHMEEDARAAMKLRSELSELAQAEADIRAQLNKLAETYQKATMDMAVAENERNQLKQLVERGRDSVSEIAKKQSVRQRLTSEIRHLESQLASLRKSESELRLQRDSLVPVQVRRWK